MSFGDDTLDPANIKETVCHCLCHKDASRCLQCCNGNTFDPRSELIMATIGRNAIYIVDLEKQLERMKQLYESAMEISEQRRKKIEELELELIVYS